MSKPPFPTIEACFEEIAARGCMVNNLMQLGPDLFRANLRRPLVGGATYFGHSEGPTPLAALNAVLTEHKLLQKTNARQKMMDLL